MRAIAMDQRNIDATPINDDVPVVLAAQGARRSVGMLRCSAAFRRCGELFSRRAL